MREFTASYRAWHWIFAFSVLFLVVTFLADLYISTFADKDILQAKMATYGADISLREAKSIEKMITNTIWDWHIYIGYLFALATLYRVVDIAQNGFGFPKDVDSHKKLVYNSYKLLYAVLVVIALTGIATHLGDRLDVSFFKDDIYEDIHELSSYILMGFIPLHILGVVFYEITKEQGLISRIVSGSKKDI